MQQRKYGTEHVFIKLMDTGIFAPDENKYMHALL